jgi:hypothetical protein
MHLIFSRARLLLPLLTVATAVHAQQPAGPEPQVTLQGILQTGEFFGPPGYGEAPDSDSIERSLYLQLPMPLGQELGAHSLPEYSDSTALSGFFVQVVVLDFQRLRPGALAGRRVKAVGTLMAAVSGHHRTQILLVVDSLVPIARWR